MSSNGVAENPAYSGISVRYVGLAGLKTLALWCSLLAGTVLAGMLIPVDLKPAKADGPLTSEQALLVVYGLYAVTLAVLASHARVRGARLGGLIFVTVWVISTAMMQIETLWFNDSLKLPLHVIAQLTARNAVMAAVAAFAAALLFRPQAAAADALPAGLWRRIALMAVLYVVLYYSAGFCIAWQSAAVRAYYENGIHVPLLPTMGFQMVRGALWALIALYILVRIKGSLVVKAAIMATVFSVFTAAQLLFPTTFFPWAVREAHLAEVGLSEFAYGIVAALVLLSGAAKRPLLSGRLLRPITGSF
jgi:hypothetical protein